MVSALSRKAIAQLSPVLLGKPSAPMVLALLQLHHAQLEFHALTEQFIVEVMILAPHPLLTAQAWFLAPLSCHTYALAGSVRQPQLTVQHR